MHLKPDYLWAFTTWYFTFETISYLLLYHSVPQAVEVLAISLSFSRPLIKLLALETPGHLDQDHCSVLSSMCFPYCMLYNSISPSSPLAELGSVIKAPRHYSSRKKKFVWWVIKKVPGTRRRERRILTTDFFFFLLHAYSNNTDQSQSCPHSTIIVKQQTKQRE